MYNTTNRTGAYLEAAPPEARTPPRIFASALRTSLFVIYVYVYMYVYVCVCICMCVCIYIYIYTSTNKCMYIYIYIYTSNIFSCIFLWALRGGHAHHGAPAGGGVHR